MKIAPELEAPDERHLRRAIQLTRLAIDLGEAPFGSLLVSDGSPAGAFGRCASASSSCKHLAQRYQTALDVE
jgi:tRNA(Arg) A34 adenosine deaminase TadA